MMLPGLRLGSSGDWTKKPQRNLTWHCRDRVMLGIEAGVWEGKEKSDSVLFSWRPITQWFFSSSEILLIKYIKYIFKSPYNEW